MTMRALAVLALVLMPLAAAAAAGPRPDIDRLLDRAETGRAMAATRDVMVASAGALGPMAMLLPDGFAAAWRASAAEAFDPAAMTADLAEGLAVVPEPYVAEIHAWLDSPVGARLLAAEIALIDGTDPGRPIAEQEAERAAAVAAWQALDPEAPRRRALVALAEAQHFVGVQVATLSGMSHAMMAGMMTALAGDLRPEESEIAALCNCDVATLRAAMETDIMAGFAGIYEGIPVADLEAYADFSRRPASQAFLGAYARASIDMMNRRMRMVGEGVGRRLSGSDL